MKTLWKIVGRVLLGVVLTVYIAVALINYSVVQSYLGTVASRYFSKEWGGEVKIGSLHAMPFDHLLLDNLLLVSPEGDTILKAETLRLRFKRFPYRDKRLELNSVYLRNAYYHFESYGKETNLQFIIDCYKHPVRKHEVREPFVVEVRNLVLNRVHYKMDLPDKRKVRYDEGVEIPHMEFLDIRAKFKHVRVAADDVTCRVVRLRCQERSGFAVTDMSGDVHVGREDITVTDLEVETDRSRILADATLRYDGWQAMKHYVSTVRHEAKIKEGTTVAMSDVAYWAPVLTGIEAQVEAHGSASGTIDRLDVEGIAAHWGRESGVALSGLLVGLPKIDTAYGRVDIDRLWTTAEDLAALGIVDNEKHTATAKWASIRVPQRLLNQVEYVDLSLAAEGGLRQAMRANVNMMSGLGNVRADANLRIRRGEKHFSVEANSDGMGLMLLGSDWLTHSGFDISAEGRFADLKDLRTVYAEMEGRLTNSVVQGHRMAPATIKAKLDGGLAEARVESTDSLATLTVDAHANLADSVHTYLADIDIQGLQLGAFSPARNGKAGESPEQWLRSSIALNAMGNDLEHLSGDVVASYTRLGELTVDNLRMHIDCYPDDIATRNIDYKRITLESDLADIAVNGRFRYADLPLIARHLCQQALPAEFNPLPEADSLQLQQLADRSLAFSIKWVDGQQRLKALTPKVNVAQGTRIDGNYNYGELLKLAVRSDSIRLGSVALDNVGISGRASEGGYLMEIETQSVLVGAIELIDYAQLSLNSNASRSLVGLAWGEASSPTRGDLLLQLQEQHISVVKPYFYVGEDRWQLDVGQLDIGVEDGLYLTGNGVSVESSQQHLNAQFSIHGRDNDFVEVHLDHFSLDNLLAIALQGSPLAVSGDIGGRFSMYGLSSTPYFNANLNIDSCAVNGQAMGQIAVRSNWNAELNILNVQVGNRQVYADGWVGLGQADPDISLNARFDAFDLSVLTPLLHTFADRLEGRLYGDVEVSGTAGSPLVMGEASVDGGVLGVSLTNVAYSFSDTLRFAGNSLLLDNFEVRDPLGNTLTLGGAIRQRGTGHLSMGLQFSTDNILVLNQRSGDQFYGTVLAAANGEITGWPGRMSVAVQARTNPGCTLTVPVSNQRQVKSQSYIHFVDDAASPDASSPTPRALGGNLNLTLDLSITPDMKLNLPMDFSEVSATVGANGSGDIHLTYDGANSPQVLGNYEIASGTMKVGLVSLIEKNFAIENGSSLNFQGNLPDARFDLRAVYSQRVNLSTLTGSLSAVDNTQKYIQVEDVIAISGTLQEPTIGFDIRLPNADQNVSDEVFAYIDRSSERDMLNQTISLLLRGSFYNANASSNNGLLDNGLSSGYSMVASTVGNMVGNMVQFVDVDIDYKAATELTNQQLDFNISKDWGRWYLESTLGYGGESRELSAANSNGAIIDALVGYRLSPLVHLFAYNRTNTNDYTRIDLPYKQGAGLKLTKDFDRWSDLFHSKKRHAKH